MPVDALSERAAPRASEQPAVGSGAVCCQMREEQRGQLGWAGHDPDLTDCAVLELTLLAPYATLTPRSTCCGRGPTDVQLAPTHVRERQSFPPEIDCLAWTKCRVVHDPEEGNERRPGPQPTHGIEQCTSLPMVDHHPRIDGLGQLRRPPLDRGDRIGRQMAQLDRYSSELKKIARFLLTVDAAAGCPSVRSVSAPSAGRRIAGSVSSATCRVLLRIQRSARTSRSAGGPATRARALKDHP